MSSPFPDKVALKASLVRELEGALARMEASAEETRRGAIHAESRPENDKDTRGLEASYLARGKAMRVVELREALARVRVMEARAFGEDEPIALSALVSLERDDGEVRAVFLAPAGGGVSLDAGVSVITPSTPLGRAVLGRRRGDEVSLSLGGEVRTFEVTEVV